MKTKFVQFLKGISLLCCAVSASGCTSFRKTYTITFKNYDGFILSTLTVNEGELPVYNAATPYRQKEGDFVYIFTGWNKELTNATKDEIYIAKFDTTCQITWLDENNNVLESDYYKVGTMPECSVILEDKKDTNHYYEFSEWTPSVEPVSKKTSYKASYSQYDRYYTVTWLNYDGDILEVDNNVERKSTPEYNSETPTKPSQGVTTYTFDGWDKEVEPVTGNITYIALFKDNRNTHAIDFRDSDGTLIKRYLVDDGAMPFFDVALPNKNDGSDSFYIFKSWDKEIVPATEDATYKAVYTKENSYIYNANNRNSTYKIVYAGTTDSASYTAATYFQTYFKQITGKFLNIYNDSNVSSNSNTQDYISFGKTKFAQKYNFTYSDDDEFCKPDYSIINNYHVLVIDGGKFGIVYAAVELLRQMFDFDYLEPENYYFNKNLSSYCTSNIVQKIFCPTIRYRQNYTAGLIRKNSMLSKMTDYGYGRGCSSDTNLFIDYSTGGRTIRNIHNALQLINKDIYKSSHPEWFSTSGNQPCMSAILKSTQAQNIIMGYYEEIAQKYPTRYLVYSLCDSYGTTTEAACNCFECEAYFHKYGNDSGLYMLLLNKLGDLIKERQAAGKIPQTVPGIMGTAYYTTSNAPFKCIDEVKAHDNVALQVCPIFHNLLRSYKECEQSYFDDWNKIMNGRIVNGFFYSLIDYSTGNYLLFHNDFDPMFDNYEIYKKAGLKYIIQLGTLNLSNDINFANLRSYLYSYLTNNDNITKDDYSRLERNYFDRYFGPAANDMYDLYSKLKTSFEKFKYITTSSHNDSWHNAFTRLSFGSIKTTKPVKDTNGNCYGIASDYDLLNDVDKSKQVVLFSNDESNDDYIGKYIEIYNKAVNSLNSLNKNSDEYELYLKRVMLNSVVLFYINLECFNDSSLMSKQEFINFCESNNIDRTGETIKLTDLISHWNIA